MKKNVKYTLIAIILACLCNNLGHAFDIDETVDDQIRKNYNPNQLVDDVGVSNTALEKNLNSNEKEIKNIDPNLPSLPTVSKSQSQNKNSDIKNNTIVSKTPPIIYKAGNTKVKAGTSFLANSNTTIADWQRKGTSIKFTTKKNLYGKNYMIPANTIFLGEIIDSHSPQISCNGGLVSIKVNSMIYKNQTVPLNAYITRANDKKIFFNNIKGERNYLKTMWRKGNWGRTLFSRMLGITINLGGEGSTLILSPFPIAYGTICLGINAITSPITAFFSKGGNVSIPAGSEFKIKLIDDIYL